MRAGDWVCKHVRMNSVATPRNDGDFAVDAIDIFRKANGKIASAQRSQGADELAAIDKVPRGLDIHVLLRWLLSPRPG